MKWILFLVTVMLFLSCKRNYQAGTSLHYDFSNMQLTALSTKLREISGLSYIGGDTLLCIQDEAGILFKISATSNKIYDKSKASKKGDYEGVIYDTHKKTYWVNSSGTIFASNLKKNKKTKHYKTFLDTKNNVEGLCLTKNNKYLLLSCKGDPGKKLPKHTSAIYAFDVKKKKLKHKPYFLIDHKEVETKLNASNNRVSRVGVEPFAPSGIAYNKLDDNYYILSHRNKSIVVVNENGEIKEVIALDRKLFKQPEGITFGDNGNLYIANEGIKGRPTLILIPRKIKG